MKPLNFICPYCQKMFSLASGSAICPDCQKDLRAEQGFISVIPDTDFYWGEITEKQLDRILLKSQNQHWKDVVTSELIPEQVETYNYLFSNRRFGWTSQLDLSGKRVLDIGAGMGSLSCYLADRVESIVSLEIVKKRAAFIQIRKEQDNLKNLIVIHGSTSVIPFTKESFDLIILNHVLEWIPSNAQDQKPREAQFEALKKIYSLLASEGIFYLCNENRYSLIYLLGFKDPHTSLKFTPILPRFFANWWSKLRLKQPYTTYFYSLLGYKKMLREVGFNHFECYAPLPSSRKYYYYINLQDFTLQDSFVQKAYDLKHPLASVLWSKFGELSIFKHLAKYFVPEYAIFTHKK